MKITKNFTLEELYASGTAKTEKIDNMPPTEAVVNLRVLAENVLQKIRDHFKQPLVITSGYRCPRLNSVLGGAANSQHTKGQAVDFVVKGYGVEEVFLWCKKNLVFDQLIQEKGQWVHISFTSNKNRKEVLRFNGKGYLKG